MPMNLPTPNADEVAEFKCLYLKRFGIELTDDEALDQATRLIQYVFLTQYALPHLQAEQAKTKEDGLS